MQPRLVLVVVCQWLYVTLPKALLLLLLAGTGGVGRYHGGDGVVRELEFLRPLTASILSERRAVRPFGLLGGGAAAAGVNLWVKRNGRVVSLGAKETVQVDGGDRIKILTPGGGGYGPPEGVVEVQAAQAAALAAAVDSKLAGRRDGAEFSVPVRDGGSVQQYVRNQETV